MRLTGLIPLVSLLVYAPAGALHDVRSSGSLPAQSATPTRPIGIILKLKEGADPEACHQRIERKLRSTGRPSRDRRLLKARPRDPRSRARVARQRFGLERLQLAYAPKGRSVEETLAAYANDPDVEYAELDAVVHILDTVPNDPLYSRLWGLEKIGAPRAWDVERGDPGVVVAVIDTGIDDAHPDLLANLWINTGEIPGNGIDDDGNGFIDDVRGYDFVNEDGKPRDDNGHGTHVAGIVGAVGDNSTGVTGVNQRVSIMALKFLDGGGAGRLSDAIRAIDYSIAMGARVLNNSWGFDVDSQALHDAVSASQAAGQLFVAAAGNSPGDADVDPHFPSGLEHDNVLSVAATDRGDLLATFSNFGLVSVDLGAPGVDILSTTPRYSTEITAEFGRHYAELSGTSMAAPHVAGVAALLLARSSLLRYDEVRARILAGVDPVPGLEVATGGRLNAAASFAGLGIGGDSDPPVSVSDLTVVDVTERSVTLEWTASGEDGTVGRAALYDLRYAHDPITAASWDASTPVFDEPPPGEAGSMESALVEGLDQGQTYFFAVRVMDRSGNYSAISNTPSATTVALVPVAIQIDQGDEQIGESGSDLEEALRVIVVDAEGHGVSRIPVAFAITEGAPGAFLDPPDALTDEDGIASTSLVLGTVAPATAGVLHRVAVSSPGLTSAEFRLGAHALVDLTPIWRNEHAVRLLDVGDADQDGFGELLTATWSYEGIELALIEAQGNDSFEEVWSFLDPRWWSLYAHGAIGDVDGDGDMEIVVYAIPSGVTEFAVPLIFERTGENSYGLVSHPIVLRTEVRTEDGL
ncbi:MAG: S8 family serine peptidase, partial [Myxococcota bacterium]